jgi:methionine synthase II (cobalamin-independent)
MPQKQPSHFQTVGSLLRPEAIKTLIKQNDGITPDQYRPYIKHVVDLELAAGLPVVTDGEYNRLWWHLDFIFHLQNCQRHHDKNYFWKFEGVDAEGDGLSATGVLGGHNHPFIQDFLYLKSLVLDRAQVKLTIPSPAHASTSFLEDIGKGGETAKHYSFQTIGEGLINAYQEFLDDYVAAGGKIIQFDDCLWETFAKDSGAEKIFGKVDQSQAHFFIGLNNAVIDYGHQLGLKVWAHNCRGNYQSTHMVSGAYDDIAQLFLKGQHYDRFFLEYDTERSGSLDALKVLIGSNKEIVLGLLSSKVYNVSNEKAVIEKLNYVFSFYPKELVYLSHQCGFSSTHHGNLLTEEQEFELIRYGIKIAKQVWG